MAARLAVSGASLRALGVGWHARSSRYTFPMRDGAGRIVGVRTRAVDGRKQCLAGSRLGLIVPMEPDPLDPDWLIVTEGESDAAAALDLGFAAVGRPGCTACVDTVVAYVDRARPAGVAIVADADEPGQLGADRLARQVARLGCRVRLLTPPDAKDLREWKTLPCSDHHALAALLEAPADREEVVP